MLRLTHSDNPTAAVAYFDGALSKGDYYAIESQGKWHGLAAARLGLIGTVERDVFATLMNNRDPRTGERLTQRTNDNRRPGTDFTFNAPKSVSLIHAMIGDDRILAAFRRAVIDTMREVERDAKTRIRVDGRQDDRTTGNIAWAEFLHATARPVAKSAPDPHLHCHAYAINATWDAHEQKWKALQLGDIFADRPYYEAAFMARLASGMRQLGYAIARKGRAFEIAGLPEPLLKAFSRRTAEIEAAAEEFGITNPKTKEQLGKRTRARKDTTMSPEELRAHWRERAGIAGRQAIEAVTRLARRRQPNSDHPDVTPKASVEFALANAFERASVATEKSIFATALMRGYGDVTPETVRAAADTFDLITGEIEGRKVVTTRQVLDEESRLIGFARAGRLTSLPLAPRAIIHDTRLNAGQRKAVEHIWTSPDRVMAIKGGAGTGKTTLMSAAVRGIAETGKWVAVFAPTSAARDVLKAEGFSGAETLQRLLLDERLQAALKNSVLWIDEAGLISVPDMARLFALAEKLDARVVLSGDYAQHGAIARGDALRIIAERAGIRPATVTEVVRQRGAYMEAVEALGRGDTARGWDLLHAQGAIIEATGQDRIAALADDYMEQLKAKKSVLVVAPTHAEKNAVTAAILARMRDAGLLGEARTFTVWRDTQWTEAQRSDPINYHPGQWVRFTQNAEGIAKGAKLQVTATTTTAVEIADSTGNKHHLPLDHTDRFKVYDAHEAEFAVGETVRITENGTAGRTKFVNGAVHTITGFDRDGNMVFDKAKVLPHDYGAIDHAVAATSIASQGRTVDTVLIAMGTHSLPAISREQFYVATSRARSECRVYTDDAVAIKTAVQRSGHRGSATELMEGELTRKLSPLSQGERVHSPMHALPRTERLKAFTEALGRQQTRHARMHAYEHDLSPDEARDLRQATKLATLAEYKGRVHERAAELGD